MSLRWPARTYVTMMTARRIVAALRRTGMGSESLIPPPSPKATVMFQNEKSTFQPQAVSSNDWPSSNHPSAREAEAEVVSLARTLTGQSHGSQRHEEDGEHADNPFLGIEDPALDPLSDKFDPVRWTKSILQIQSNDPDGYPHHTAAVSFSDLNVYGYGKSTDHQKTVGNYLLDIPGMVRNLFGSKGQRIDILQNFEGVVRESEMLVVLGRPGSGCSTLLKTIAGETHGLNITEHSHINYQGISFPRMHKQFRGEVVYNAENDVHFPNMTVGQTLSFAARARTPRTRLPGVSRERWAEHMKDVVMAIFGLTHTVNTKVGNDFIRGISGGERKRVSIAEVALSGSPLQCWDNSTRGLDSATALEFVKSYISSSKSKGEVLVFRKGHVPQMEKISDDKESGSNSTRSRDEPIKPNSVAAIQRQVATFHWEDVVYDIKIKGKPRRLLDHVDGWVKPGTLTALMGASGAGKTTLLDTLANRVTVGVVSGKMLIDGHERDSSFQRNTGYAQQQDLHLPTSTVREALMFSARLRQSRTIPDSEKAAYVEEVIHLLEMEKYADAVVGVTGEGLNVEQRKRLTIGVELVAKPGLLLFLDEPTSGLDSQTAWSICTLLRKLANNGQAILCTIHQPSAILFQSFDRLLLLQHGGQTVYYGDIGENSSTLINYFESQGAETCPPKANPAEWMLKIWQFMLYTSTFAHMLIAGIDSDLAAGNIAGLLYCLTFLSCGVLAGPSGPNSFPHFWIFMYRVSPFTYLVDSMLSVGVANAPATCSDIEVRHFEPPNGQTCGQYLQAYMRANDGSLANPNATSDCQFCEITTTNTFLSKVHSTFDLRWRNFGFLWAYIIFNIVAAMFFYWLARVPKGNRVKKQ
ncbi:P-loop containing nucleoside triphosphate hydrolase protein [Rickenella mellea]|uniref:P-loop containing nucleoside triphosphate hydrolase protein n=1 Tax=Rickenella mellea TaxID=50990 RepID=A0A4Y7PHE3_9AGAM|nr:P-loop containing nucleoside triphosphate hydrolase protein [Rickenella mellea]